MYQFFLSSAAVVVPNVGPVADFAYEAASLVVTFTDASTDSDGTITDWLWSFGDGETSTEQSPTHTYAAGGTYTASLTVTDDRGDSDTVSQSITLVYVLTPPYRAELSISSRTPTLRMEDA